MNLQVTKEAAKWYKQELDIDSPSFVRFYVRYGGVGGLIPGFSLGISIDTPNELHASCKTDELTFYVDVKDAWYFDDKDLEVTFNDELNEPKFNYV